MNIENEVTGLSSKLLTPTMAKIRCVSYVCEHVVGEGCMFGFCLYCYSKTVSAAKLAHHVGSPFLVLALQCSLWIYYLLLTKVDMWEWCCTRKGFSLSSTRFSTFFCPCWSLGGHVQNLLKDARERRRSLCFEKWRGAEWFVKPHLRLMDSSLCQWLKVQGYATSL